MLSVGEWFIYPRWPQDTEYKIHVGKKKKKARKGSIKVEISESKTLQTKFDSGEDQTYFKTLIKC